jgi:hypothetical protein
MYVSMHKNSYVFKIATNFYLGFARERFKRLILISNVSARYSLTKLDLRYVFRAEHRKDNTFRACTTIFTMMCCI